MVTSFKRIPVAALIISIIWHILIMTMIEPTFGARPIKKDFAKISFLGSILKASDLSFEHNFDKFVSHSKSLSIKRIGQINFKVSGLYEKYNDYFSPLKEHNRALLSLNCNNRQKRIFMDTLNFHISERYTKDAPLVFHPILPYSFPIYFKDRQRAHIEFTFYISDTGKVSFINRKISSGNLEADLLASRYITRHLNLVKAQFLANTWQTVKIDLSRKDDRD